MNKEELALYSWIIRGKQRVEIVRALTKPKTPKQLSKETNIKFSNITDGLRLMKAKGVAVCLNPKERMGRLYMLTNKGLKIQKELLKE